MYTNERVQWWLGRSRSPEYQAAYKRIASYVPTDARVVIDVACGPGYILKRLYDANPNRLLIGMDASETMLAEAQGRFAGNCLVPKIIMPDQLDPKETGVVLVKDTLIDTQLPSELFDVTLFTFPELGAEYEPNDIDRRLITRYQIVSGPIAPEDYDDMGVTFRGNFHLTRITKKNGVLISTNYNIQENEASMHGSSSLYSKMFGLLLDSVDFFEDRKIYSDVDERVKLNTPKGSRCGYFIVKRVRSNNES